ncbi:hypothetical protein CIB48_g2698 [Xylaria polymorpha]|nr:hypothetical protein CIB48_g2698 [Xylaria polymorpha]
MTYHETARPRTSSLKLPGARRLFVNLYLGPLVLLPIALLHSAYNCFNCYSTYSTLRDSLSSRVRFKDPNYEYQQTTRSATAHFRGLACLPASAHVVPGDHQPLR